MLAHLQHLDFFHLLEDLEVRHLLFQHLLDGVLLTSLVMNGKFDQAVCAFTQLRLLAVVMANVNIIHGRR